MIGGNCMTQANFSLDDALICLNRITSSINVHRTVDEASINLTLELIARDTVDLIPGSRVSICSFDPARGTLEPSPRVAVGKPLRGMDTDLFQTNGLVLAALRHKVRQFSWENPTVKSATEQAACFPLF
jgi:hypothetical protein